MSQYEAPDKSTGQDWTALEHNEMKVAINSKMDADKLKQDFYSPNNNDFPSTQAVADLVGPEITFKYRGNLGSADNLDTKKLPGFWMIPTNITGSHSSFPVGFTTTDFPGELLVYSKSGLLTQIISTTKQAASNARSAQRSSADDGVTWSAWYELAYQDWIASAYGDPDTTPDGNPVIEAGADYTVVETGCIDKSGLITINNISATTTNGNNVIITFEHERTPAPSVALLTKYFTGDAPVTFEVYALTSLILAVRIIGELPIGQSAAFYYKID